MLGRKPDLAEPRAGGTLGGWRTVFTRSKPAPGMMKNAALVLIGGYIFHLGFFITLLLFSPHILFFQSVLGLSWPALSNGVIEVTAILSIGALIALGVHRFLNPVRRFLSTFQDYFVWLVTLLPLLTGYLLLHNSVFTYTQMLAMHILSVELLLVIFPFTKLMHAFTFIVSRWYTGAMAARKGVAV
jgi:nitrate reductase gamma subunit